METSTLVWFVFAAPFAAGASCSLIPRPRLVLRLLVLVSALVLAAALALTARGMGEAEPELVAGGWLRVDTLAGYHLSVLALVFLVTSVFAVVFFEPMIRDGRFGERKARRFGALWLGSFGAMALLLSSNNLGLMWVAMEATTVLTAFLIALEGSRRSLEAMWKYLIVCSVGIAFAFMGTLLAAAAVPPADGGGAVALEWTYVMARRTELNPTLMRAAFIFILVGYGTKAGLAPMHIWLPDAHSQAPAPVSAMFSGFMLNTALYAILRYVPLVEGVAPGFAPGLLVTMGVFSILVAAAFIIVQRDAKRMLAYHSVEHLGIIALGFGLGPLGTQAALFHTLNHAVCKSLGFCSIGQLGQIYGSHEIGKIRGALAASPVWGFGLFGALLALVGVAPFAIFMSELQLIRAAIHEGEWAPLVLFLLGSSVVFVAALKHGIAMAFGKAPAAVSAPAEYRKLGIALVGCLLALSLVLGTWMPRVLRAVIYSAAGVLTDAT